jgi:hypothetical protein
MGIELTRYSVGRDDEAVPDGAPPETQDTATL